jgi:hypothetical protein
MAALTAGCVAIPVGLGGSCPPEQVSQILAVWQNSIMQAADPLRGGAPYPCLVGKLYLFAQGDTGRPIVGEGRVTNELIDESSGKQVTLHRWDYPADVMRQLGKKDVLGWCYMMPLPLPEGMPPLTKVRIRTGYLPAKGIAVYNESAITLDSGNGIITSGGPPLNANHATVKR